MYIFLEKLCTSFGRALLSKFWSERDFFQEERGGFWKEGEFSQKEGDFEEKERGVGEKWAAFWPEK